MSKQEMQRDVLTMRHESVDTSFMNMEKPEIVMGISSIIGTRKNQQDSVFGQVVGNRSVAIVCDGMGGMNGGEMASQTAVKMLAEDVLSRGKIANIPEFLRKEAVKMDKAVCSLKDEQNNPLNGGTTVVAAIIEDNNLYWLSVGDSKIYIIRNDEIVSVNREHNYRLRMDDELKKGIIDETEYKKKEKDADSLISYIGIGNVSLMDVNQTPFKLEENDIVVLCSDGLYKRLPDKEIYRLIHFEEPDMERAARRLTDIVMKRTKRAQDNTSVILLKYGKY